MSSLRLITFAILATLAGTAGASGGGGGPPPGAKSEDVSKAERLIKSKKWDEAVKVLQRAVERDDTNADAYNWLGYAERNRGNTDAAFAAYDKALQLDPDHRGAHEYVGEAYLLVNNLEKAREHLAALRSLCGKKCEEYEDLEKAIAAYQAKHAS